MTHLCHAHGCERKVPPHIFMCRGHWYSLPKAVRDAIWFHYRSGQEITKDPSPSYMAVQQYAIALILSKSRGEHVGREVAKYLETSKRWRDLAVGAGNPDPTKGFMPISETSSRLS